MEASEGCGETSRRKRLLSTLRKFDFGEGRATSSDRYSGAMLLNVDAFVDQKSDFKQDTLGHRKEMYLLKEINRTVLHFL